MRTDAGTKFRLVGVLEGMRVDEPAGLFHGGYGGVSVTDVRLPVPTEDDDDDDCASPGVPPLDARDGARGNEHDVAGVGDSGPDQFAPDQFAPDWPEFGPGREPPGPGSDDTYSIGTAYDAYSDEHGYDSDDHRGTPGRAVGRAVCRFGQWQGQGQGRGFDEEAGLAAVKGANAPVRSSSVAYYRSQYARHTSAGVMPGHALREGENARDTRCLPPFGDSRISTSVAELYEGRHRDMPVSMFTI